jgi:MFS family permease
MLPGALLLAAGLFVMAGLTATLEGERLWAGLLLVWLILGAGYSLVLTPSGRLLRRSAGPAERPALFAARFALSHACWLVTYPLAGWLGVAAGMAPTLLLLGAVAALAAVAAARLWPAHDPEALPHVHADLPPGHPHIRDAQPVPGGFRHVHAFVIDRHHRSWPRP